MQKILAPNLHLITSKVRRRGGDCMLGNVRQADIESHHYYWLSIMTMLMMRPPGRGC